MSAYVIADSAVLDGGEGLGLYVNLAAQSLAPYSGRFVLQGQAPVAVEEGDWPEGRLVTLLEFPDLQRAKDWYSSDEYKKAIAARQGVLDVRFVFVDGKMFGES